MRSTDNACQTGYGPNHVCVSGACVTGNCHTADRLQRRQDLRQQQLRRLRDDVACASAYGAGAPLHLGRLRRRASAAPPSTAQAGEICSATFTCTTCKTDADVRLGLRREPPVRRQRLHRGRLPVDRRLRRRSALQHGDVHVRALPRRRELRRRASAPLTCAWTEAASPAPAATASQCAAGEVCDANNYMCRMCGADAECVSGYGANHLCESGACIPGQCRTSPECPNGGLCERRSHTCGACATDAACVAGYGTNHLCVNGACVSGTCHSTVDCGGGGRSATATFSCVACASDAACVTAYGPQHLCIGNVCVDGRVPRLVRLPGRQDLRRADADLQRVRQRHRLQRRSVVRRVDGLRLRRLHLRRLPRLVVRLPDRPAVRHRAAQHLRRLLDRRAVHGRSRLRRRQHLLPGHLPAGELPRHQRRLHRRSDRARLRRLEREHLRRVRDRLAVPGRPELRLVDDLQHDHRPDRQRPVRQRVVQRERPLRGQHRNDFCCGGLCTAGNCCVDADCAANPSFGPIYRCVNNSCTGCSAATGNKYFVDPDRTATTRPRPAAASRAASPRRAAASRPSPARCRSSAASRVPGTQIVIVGQSGRRSRWTRARRCRSSCRRTSRSRRRPARSGSTCRPAAIRTSRNVAGFQLGGDLAAIAPDPAAPHHHRRRREHLRHRHRRLARRRARAPSLSYVTVQNTGGHGIAVSNGTLSIGPGVASIGRGDGAQAARRSQRRGRRR